MNSLSQVLRIAAILAACLAAFLFFKAQNTLEEKDLELNAAIETQEKTQADLAEAHAEVATLKATIIEERDALADSKRKQESIRSEMLVAQQELSQTQSKLKQSQKKVSNLELDLTGARSKLVSAERRVANSGNLAELAALKERVTELESANKTLQSALDSAKSVAP